jgi:catechol 2,3-dioxygenase-like lactoylglutathione lyase family enzyme
MLAARHAAAAIYRVISMDRATANLPSSDIDRTAAFYQGLGFAIAFKDAGWLILTRDTIELEFFRHAVDPKTTIASACLRVDDLDALRDAFARAGLQTSYRGMPRLTPIEDANGLRLFALVDADGNLLRCIENHHNAISATTKPIAILAPRRS